MSPAVKPRTFQLQNDLFCSGQLRSVYPKSQSGGYRLLRPPSRRDHRRDCRIMPEIVTRQPILLKGRRGTEFAGEVDVVAPPLA
jgi:hypothetical protein